MDAFEEEYQAWRRDEELASEMALERGYEKMLDEFAAGQASQWIDEAALQIADAVCRELAAQLKANPNMFAVGSDNAPFLKIGLIAARAADNALNDAARLWA